MKVQYRLLAICVILGAAFIGGFLLMQNNQRAQLANLAQGRKIEMEQLFQSILDLDHKEMRTIVFDYTYWDELVSFVKTGDPNFAHDTLDTSLDSYQINAIWVYDSNLKLIYSTTNLPEKIAPPLNLSDDEIRGLFQSSYLGQFAYYLSDGTLMDVRGATIHPSNDAAHQTPAQGYFFAGRTMNDARISNLSKMVGGKVEIVGKDQAKPGLVDSGTLVIDAPVADVSGKPLAYIRGSFQNLYLEEYKLFQQRELIFYLFSTASILTLFIAGLQFWVARPLARISASLAHGDPQQVHLMTLENSEFGHIARLIRDFFDQREEMAQKIRLLENAQTALQSSELRYRTFSELSSDATYSLIVTGQGEIQIEWGRESLARIAGFQPGETQDESRLLTVLFRDGFISESNWVENLLAEKKRCRDYPIRTQNGEIRWIRNQLQPAPLPPTSDSLRLYGTAQDITNQKAAEEAYHTLVDHSIQGLAIYQDDFFVFANPAFLKMTGNTLEELGTLSRLAILARLDLPSTGPDQAAVVDFFSEKIHSVKFKIRVLHQNETWRWLDILGEWREYQRKQAIQLACVDITERIQSELALQDQTDYSTMIFRSVGSPVLILSPEGRIVNCNPACELLIGKKSEQVKDRFLWDLFHIPETSPIGADHFQDKVKTLATINGQDIRVVENGKVSWLSWTQSYKLGPAGEVMYILGSAIDITERVMLARQHEATSQIATTLKGNLTRAETAQNLLDKIRDLLSADSVGLAFPIPDRDDLLIEFAQGELRDTCQGKLLILKDNPPAKAWQTGQPQLAHTIPLNLARISTPESQQPGSIAWLPLRIESECLGLLFVARHETLSQDDMDLLVPVAGLVAGSIDRANHAERDQRQVQQLSALQSIYLGIVTSLDLNFTMHMIVIQATSQLGIDAVDMLLLNPQTQMLRFAAQSGFQSQEVETTQLWLGESQAGRVAMERRSRHLYDPDGIATYFSSNEVLKRENFIAYDAVPLVVKGEVKGVLEAFHRAPYTVSEETQELLEALALLTAIAIDHAEIFEQLQRKNQDLHITLEATIESWAHSLELWDYETKRHSIRVVTLTEKLAQWMGISGDQLTNIRRGALLHDIGKIGIPDSIYQKPGKLTSDEWIEIVKHPGKAYEILNNIPFLRSALDIVYGHHERWNGNGYPQGLSGEQIPLAARIFAVVDIFDALMSSRSYKGPWSEENALNYLKETAGKELDPTVVEAFLNMYPILKKSHLLDELYKEGNEEVAS